MSEFQLVMLLISRLRCRYIDGRLDPERGDVAEKIVIVGIFVAMAITAGVLIQHAVNTSAVKIAHKISTAP